MIEIFPTSCTCFLGWFLFQLTAKANQPNGWKRYIFLDWNNQKHSLALVVQCSPRNGNPRYLHELLQNRDLKRKGLKFLDNIQHDRWKVSPIACLRIIQSHVPRMNSDTSSELLMCAGAYFCTTVCRKGIYDGNSHHVNQSQNKNWYCDWLKGVSSKPSGKLIVAPFFFCF